MAKLSDGPLTRIGAAAHSVRALTRSELDEFASATVGRHVHAHVSEQPAENAACVAFHGLTPTELLADLGLLDERFTAVHATISTCMAGRARQYVPVPQRNATWLMALGRFAGWPMRGSP